MGFVKIRREFSIVYINTDKIEFVTESTRSIRINMDNGTTIRLDDYRVEYINGGLNFVKREEEIPF